MRRIAVSVLAVAIATVLGYVLIIAPASTRGVDHRSSAGGFAIKLDEGWNVRTLTDAGPVWLEGERTNRLGVDLSWMWIARWNAGGDDTLAVAERAVRNDIRKHWGDTRITETKATIGGVVARRLRYSRPPRQLGQRRPLGSVAPIQEVRYVARAGDQVYEVGFGGWFRVPAEAKELAERVELFAPRGSRTLTVGLPGDKLSLSVPAEWNTDPTAVRRDLTMVAAAPPHPASVWVVVWTYEEPVHESVDASLRAAARKGEVLGRTDVVLDGRPATRVDFAQAVDHAPRANFSTWIFETGKGRSSQLLVGAIDSVTVDEDAIARSVRFAGV